jgi:hypothetical protein
MSKKPAAPIVEPCPITSVFVDELGAMTHLGAVTHLIFSARQEIAYDGSTERVVQARLIVPTDQLQKIGRALLAGQVDAAPVDATGEPAALH